MLWLIRETDKFNGLFMYANIFMNNKNFINVVLIVYKWDFVLFERKNLHMINTS